MYDSWTSEQSQPTTVFCAPPKSTQAYQSYANEFLMRLSFDNFQTRPNVTLITFEYQFLPSNGTCSKIIDGLFLLLFLFFLFLVGNGVSHLTSPGKATHCEWLFHANTSGSTIVINVDKLI